LGPRGDGVGKAGELADRDLLAIWFGGVRVAHKVCAIRPMTKRRFSDHETR